MISWADLISIPRCQQFLVVSYHVLSEARLGSRVAGRDRQGNCIHPYLYPEWGFKGLVYALMVEVILNPGPGDASSTWNQPPIQIRRNGSNGDAALRSIWCDAGCVAQESR